MKFFLATIPCFFWLSLFAQSDGDFERCGTFEIHQEKMATDPEYANSYAEKMQKIELWKKNRSAEAKADCDEILFIPVAVHFQDVDIDYACAVEMAVDQVASVNEDYAGTNEDFEKFENAQPQMWGNIQSPGSCIQFCLATLDHPAESGIPEGDYAVTLNQYSSETENVPAWSGYLNFYVRELAGVLGFSPLGGDGNGDGVVCGISSFSSVNCGGNNLQGNYNLGRTISHEVGHYLSLSHPFDSGNCTADGDGIDDTPLTDEATYGCYAEDEEIIHCDEPKLWPSYMDYVDDACMYMFTAGQVENMEAYVNTSLENLLNSATIKCEDAACVGFDVSFTSQDETCDGNDGSITFNASGGQEPYAYSVSNGLQFSENNSFQSLAEDKYYLLVTDDAGCEYVDSVVIDREVPPMELIRKQSSFCGDNSGWLEVEVNHPDEFEYSISGAAPWQDTTYFGNLVAGTYTVVTRNAANCTNQIEVTIEDDSDLRLSKRVVKPVNCPLLDNGLIELEVGNGEEPVRWRFNDGPLLSDAYFDRLSPGTYNVSVEDARGCRSEFEFDIRVSYTNVGEDCPCEVYIPNAITPDEDGLNDIFKTIPSCPVTDFELVIANRWGEVVFETDNVEEGWNGGADGYYVGPDVFFYRVMYRWGEERNESLDRETRTGTITILR